MSGQMSGGHAIAAAIRRHGADVVFGLPGAQIYPLFDGFAAHDLRVIVPRHEQTAGYMAMGYGKSTGRVGIMAVVPGPGVLNASAALCTAAGNCSPVLCLTGQIPSGFLGQGRGHLHELPDQLTTLRSFIKDAHRIDAVPDAPAVIDTAMTQIRTGRPGPVSVEMCWDTMAMSGDVVLEPPRHDPAPADADPEAIAAAVRLIEQSRRPMIMCGAGAQHASEAVRHLAGRLGAPVMAFRSGRGVVAEDDPLGVNPVAARLLWDETDLLIGIGSRLEMPYMRWGDMLTYRREPAGGPRLIRLDIDPAELDRFIGDTDICADADVGCRALIAALESSKAPGADRRLEIEAARNSAMALIARLDPHAAYLGAIRDVLPRNGFLVPELCQAGFTSYTGAFPVLEPRTYVTEGYQGTLGFGFPTALGVKVANPDRAVVSITGDGGFMFAAQELATAARYNIGVVTCLFNNDSFGNVLRDQQTQYGGRIVGAELQNPDFVRLAESFGVGARTVTSPVEFRKALESALAADVPALIEIRLDPASEVSPWPLIHMARAPEAGESG